MKNIINTNNKNYLDIRKLFEDHNLSILSELKDSDTFSSLNSIANATKTELTFFSDFSQLHILKKTKAKACLINKKYLSYLPEETLPIFVENPYNSFAILSNLFFKDDKSNNMISNFVVIHNTSLVNKNVQIDSFVEIKKNCNIGSNVIIESNCSIGPNVTILENTVIKSNSTLLNCTVGSNCTIKSGAIIGGSGFGFDPISKIKIQHLGNVIIKNNCHIGSNSTIDRAVFESTIISENSFIDNLVQIAHNVVIGKGAIIAAQTGIAGSTKIGDNLITGGQVGISGHLNIGNNVKIAAKSGVTKNINDNSVIAGFPAIDIKKWKLIKIKEAKL